ncbi:DUF4232 domain-containing protein [Amycolatopsis sp. DSM 110486]|nr:DUF4232 domain-containing protein [Amycolatopsis sp. DSM 110486]QYN24342.1 DUF4232 domain-containing protein [Amycolatopsis sp. DSM 110486]
MTKPRIPLVFLAALGASGALLLSACGSGTTPTASNTPSSDTSASTSDTSPAPTASSSESSSDDSTPASGRPVDNGLCKAGDVTLSLGQGDAGAGSVYRPILIKNSSSKACTIQGFPGVSYVAGDDGHQVGDAAFREGTKGDAIKLQPGQSAAADVQFAQAANFDPAVCKPTSVKGLRVYLPQETASKFLPDPGTGCAGGKLPGFQLAVKTVRRA